MLIYYYADRTTHRLILSIVVYDRRRQDDRSPVSSTQGPSPTPRS